jgi:CubicO group peptidase (beta-lactamase class C family)
VAREDAPWTEESYGYADRARRRKITPDTRFQLASVSKTITSAAILRLVERGRLSLDDDVRHWFPEAPIDWLRITIRQLLAHTSGLPHWDDLPRLSLYRPIDPRDLRSAFARVPLHFRPGTQWRYSSPGYVLLAQIVERITRRPYAAFLATEFFRPLGLESMRAGSESPVPALDARGYRGSRARPSFDLDGVGMGAGDIWTNAADLLRWNRAYMGGQVLGPCSIDQALHRHADVPMSFEGVSSVAYGFGWFIGTSKWGEVIFHTGGNAGFTALNAWLPRSSAWVVILSNSETLPLFRTLWQVTDDLLGAT